VCSNGRHGKPKGEPGVIEVRKADVLTVRLRYVNDLYDRSVEQLTEVMPKASVGLVLSYHAAVNSLSKELQQKDWGFSVSDGKLVFLEGNDKLSEKDLAELRKAFGDTDVESSANQVADAVVESVNLRRKSSTD
jgi:transposase-like protein